MSAIACLVLLALLGAVCNGSAIKRESPPQIVYDPCFINGNWYEHGVRVENPCGLCGCLDGRLYCSKAECIVDGELALPPITPADSSQDGSSD